jgi:hypothetical protein
VLALVVEQTGDAVEVYQVHADAEDVHRWDHQKAANPSSPGGTRR